VWVQREGPVQLLDMPLGPPEPPEQGRAPGPERALALLGQVARLVLAEEGWPAAARPLPLHATALLARLVGAGRPYSRVEELQADLAATRDRPRRVTRLRRGLQLLVQACLCVVALVFSYVIFLRLFGTRTESYGIMLLRQACASG
jgi:hypothetical protein